MRPVIAFTAHNRLGYMRQALDSWSDVRGIDEATLVFHVEPGCPEMTAMCQSATFGHQVVVIENEHRLGELRNPWRAIETGFGYGDYVVYAEDDDVVSTDTLEYFLWAQHEFANDRGILTVNGFRTHAAGSLDEVLVTSEFTSWVWAVWADRWTELLRDDWDHDYTHKGWDWRIIDYWIGLIGMRVAQPALSRVQHIGKLGAHFREGDLERLQSTCFSSRVGPRNYRTVK